LTSFWPCNIILKCDIILTVFAIVLAFLFMWQFFIPLVTCSIAYWKILRVVRSKAKAAAAGPQRNTATSGEPVAGTSLTTVEQVNVGSVDDNSQRDKKGNVTAGSKGHREVGGQKKSTNKELSRAQINVVKTMIYVTICFTLCLMPMYIYFLLTTFKVN